MFSRLDRALPGSGTQHMGVFAHGVNFAICYRHQNSLVRRFKNHQDEIDINRFLAHVADQTRRIQAFAAYSSIVQDAGLSLTAEPATKQLGVKQPHQQRNNTGKR